MKKLLFLGLAAFAISSLNAQDDIPAPSGKHVPNFAIVKTLNGKKVKGWFYQFNDSNLVLLDKKFKNPKSAINSVDHLSLLTHEYKFENISSISLQKKNSVLKGMLIGMGVGIVTGAIIGLAGGDDPVQPYTGGFGDIFIAIGNAFALTAGQKALYGAIGLGATGLFTGLIIGAVAKKKFIIGGNRHNVRDLDAELRQRLLLP